MCIRLRSAAWFITGMVFALPQALCQVYSPDLHADHCLQQPVDEPNILLIIADDLGVDCVEAYGEHPDPGRTPVIDSLAANGLLFRNAWSYPTCTPARACMLTGRHAYRTGLGHYIHYETSTFELSVNEETVAKILKPRYRTAVTYLSRKSFFMGGFRDL